MRTNAYSLELIWAPNPNPNSRSRVCNDEHSSTAHFTSRRTSPPRNQKLIGFARSRFCVCGEVSDMRKFVVALRGFLVCRSLMIRRGRRSYGVVCWAREELRIERRITGLIYAVISWAPKSEPESAILQSGFADGDFSSFANLVTREWRGMEEESQRRFFFQFCKGPMSYKSMTIWWRTTVRLFVCLLPPSLNPNPRCMRFLLC